MSVTANTDNMGTATGVTAAVEQKLSQLKLSRLREVYPQWVKEAEVRQLSYLEFLDGLLAEEVVGRQENQIRRQLKAAGFPFAATLEHHAEMVVITGQSFRAQSRQRLEQLEQLEQEVRSV